MTMNQLATQDAVDAWKVAHSLVLDVYRLSNNLPHTEQQGLVSRIRNSVVVVASKVVEGHAGGNSQSYAAQLLEAQTALEETKYSLLVCRDLGYISEATYDSIMNDAENVAERLTAVRNRLTQTPAQAPTPAPGTPVTARPPAFAVKKGVRDTWSDLLGWLKGGRARMQRQQLDNVWTEETPVTSYLEGPDDRP